jgi:hypothetical protein
MTGKKDIRPVNRILIALALFTIFYAGPAYAAGPADQCTHVFTMLPNMPFYNVDFNPGYKFSHGKYLVCSGTTLSAIDISEFNFLCSDTVVSSRLPILIGWTYNSDTWERKAITGNAATVSSVDRWDVFGSGSKTIGTTLNLHTPDDNFDIYTFNSPGNYKVFIDMIHGYCDNPADYACPWLGGTWRSSICRYGVVDTVNEAEGWVASRDYDIVVVEDPSLDVKNKPAISVSRGKQTFLPWKIINNGSVMTRVTVTSDCNGWQCGFLGYSGGTIELYPGDVYCLVLNVSVSNELGVKNKVGVKITYDDTYGLSCFSPRTIASYTEVTTTEKALTLSYTVTDDNSNLLDCNLYTDIGGAWGKYDTQAVVNGSVAYVNIPNIGRGTYTWNVNCTDITGKSAWAENTWRTIIT